MYTNNITNHNHHDNNSSIYNIFAGRAARPCNWAGARYALSAYGRFPKFHRISFGRDPGTLKSDIVSTKTFTINLFGFETLKLKIRRLKLWKPTVRPVRLLRFWVSKGLTQANS